jgi:hypothetical protein
MARKINIKKEECLMSNKSKTVSVKPYNRSTPSAPAFKRTGNKPVHVTGYKRSK